MSSNTATIALTPPLDDPNRLKRKWPKTKEETRDALQDQKWLRDVMGTDTTLLSLLLRQAEWTIKQMTEWDATASVGLNESHLKLATDQDKKEAKKHVASADPVRAHIMCFATADGFLSAAAMKAGHDRIGVTDGVNLKIRAIRNLLSDRFPDKVKRGEEFTVDDLLTITNPARTQYWTDTSAHRPSQFDREKLARDLMAILHARPAPAKDEKTIIVRHEFDPILEKRAHGTGKAGTVFRFLPVSWRAVTSGSIDELIRYFGDKQSTHDDGTTQPAISAERLEEFYAAPQVTYERRRQEFAAQFPKEAAAADAAMMNASANAKSGMGATEGSCTVM